MNEALNWTGISTDKVEFKSYVGLGLVRDQVPVASFGSGGGTRGRAMAYCLSRPSLNPRMDLGFFSVQNCHKLFSLGVGLFQITCNGTVHTLTSSFLSSFTMIKFINCNLTVNQEKGQNKSKKRQGEATIFMFPSFTILL